MFNASDDSSHSTRLVVSESIEYFDDQDLSSLQFWILIGDKNQQLIYLNFHLSSSFYTILGVFISFAIVIVIFSSINLCYEVFIKHRHQFHQDYARRLQAFQVN